MSEEGKHDFDAKQLKEIMDTIGTEVPKLLDSISKVLCNTESANQMGKAIALFYKELVAAGMAPERAYQLTRDYMSNFSLGGIISTAVGGGIGAAAEHAKNHRHDD